MKILFDNGTARAISLALRGHDIEFARDIGWHQLKNGELVRQAETAGFDVLLSTDKNIRYQQNLKSRKLALVILGHPQWPVVQLHLDKTVRAVEASMRGSYIEVEIPRR